MIVGPKPRLSGFDSLSVQLGESKLPLLDQLRRLPLSPLGAGEHLLRVDPLLLWRRSAHDNRDGALRFRCRSGDGFGGGRTFHSDGFLGRDGGLLGGFFAVFFTAGLAGALAFFCAAQRAFCAAAIRALPSALIVRLAAFFATGTTASGFLLVEPLGRPRRLPAGSFAGCFVVATAGASALAPASSSRAFCNCVIC